ncbi:MAG TPA: GNAT family N-acetyltransferase [Vicinamibacterales bacterium]|nr:GNAT family N-acetyltransferase [Vicinamibacterales bacterium]
MIIERVDTLEGFRGLRSAWEAVYHADPEAQFFLSWKWLAGVLESYPEQWVVLTARDVDHSYLGFLPLRVKIVWSKSHRQLRNELQFAGRLFWADYGGILCRPERDEDVHGAFASQLKQMNWSHIVLKGFRASDRRFATFMAPFADERLIVDARTSTINKGETDNLIAPFIDLPETFEAYLSQNLSPNTRQKTRRLLRKLESSGEYQVTTTSAATDARDLQILEELWRNMWKERKGSDTEYLAAKYRIIVKRGLDDGLVHMPVLWHRDRPVGALASFVDRDKSRLLFFVGGRDEAFPDLPVGLALHIHNIRWAIEHGIRTYDLLRGDEPYKYSLGAVDARVRYPSIRTKSGINLNGRLDPSCVAEALRVADTFATRACTQEAVTSCQQVLATVPEQETAKRLLTTLADAS